MLHPLPDWMCRRELASHVPWGAGPPWSYCRSPLLLQARGSVRPRPPGGPGVALPGGLRLCSVLPLCWQGTLPAASASPDSIGKPGLCWGGGLSKGLKRPLSSESLSALPRRGVCSVLGSELPGLGVCKPRMSGLEPRFTRAGRCRSLRLRAPIFATLRLGIHPRRLHGPGQVLDPVSTKVLQS